MTVLDGLLTFLVWALVHVLALPLLRNRLRALFTGQRSSRLIPEPASAPGGQ